MGAPPTTVIQPLHTSMTMADRRTHLSPAGIESIAGLSAGTISTIICHPLDVIKTRLQIQIHTSQAPSTATSILKTFFHSSHPLQNLYRGLTPNLLGNATSWAIFFTFKSKVEDFLLLHRSRLSPFDYAFSAGSAGVATTMLTAPIWVLKTRMLSSDRGAQGAYTSMFQGAKHILRTDGIRGFWRGAGASLLGNSHGMVQFGVYDPMKRLWRTYVQSQGNTREDKMSNTATLVIGTGSKVVAAATTYPYQVLRSKLQTYDAEARFGKGIRGVVRNTWRQNGWKGFYSGFGPGVFRVLPANCVTFLVYENVRFYLGHRD